MKYLLSATAASALLAGTAFAGNIEPAPMEPVIAPAPAPVFTSPNWTGFYAGGQLGYGSIDVGGTAVDLNDDDDDNDFRDFIGLGNDADGFVGGLTLGYDYDFGAGVVGAGFDYDWTDISVAGTDIDSIWRAKLRAGYKLGNGLLYATGGYANADTNNLGDEDGYFVGAGYEHLVTESISLGGEVLYHEFDGFSNGVGSDIDVEATTAQVRATFRF